MLAKPDGGKRGIALVHEMSKLTPAIYMYRLTRLQRMLPTGTLCSGLNVAYQRSLSTAHVWDNIDFHACRARSLGLILCLLEYDFFKFFDQIDRRILVAWMWLACFPLSMLVAFSRRYRFQRLVCATACGITIGFARAWYGIDQGASDSPFWSQLFQLAFLMALDEGLKEMCPLGHFVTAFADNHWVGIMVPINNIGLLSDVVTFISTLLRMCGLVVKPSSVNLRLIGDVRTLQNVNLGSLQTINHLDGTAVTIIPHLVGATESASILGIAYGGAGSWEEASASRHSSVWFHLRSCLLRQRRLRFLEVMLRAYVYSRSQYAAPFAFLAWEDLDKIRHHVDRHRRKQLAVSRNFKLSLMMELPIIHGGMNMTAVILELSIIPMVRVVDDLLNREDPESLMRADFICTPDANRLTRKDTRRRIEQAMILLSPYGISWIDQKFHIIGRSLSILREHMAITYGGSFSIVPLHEVPTEGHVLTHSMYVVGGELHAILVSLWNDIKPLLNSILPMVDTRTPYEKLIPHPTYNKTPGAVSDKIAAMLWVKRAGCPGFASLRGFAEQRDWNKIAWALVVARVQCDYDILLQCIAAGAPVTIDRHDPDWIDGKECPLVAMLDDRSPLSDEAIGAMQRACDNQDSFVIGSDGSSSSRKDEEGHPINTILSSAAVGIIAVRGNYSDWKKMTLEEVNRAMIASFAAPFQVATGHETTHSYQAEAMAVLLRIRTMAYDDKLKEAMARSLTLVDAASIVDRLTGMISSEVSNVIDITRKEISNGPAAFIFRRIIRILKRMKFSIHDVRRPATDSMARALQDCPQNNSVTKQVVCKPAPFTINNGSWAWLRAHQHGQKGAGPCSTMVLVNHLADKMATEASKRAPVEALLPQKRTTKKQKMSGASPPVTYTDHTATFAPEDVNVVKIAAASTRFTLVMKDRAIYDNSGITLRAIHTKQILEVVQTKSSRPTRTESLQEHIWPRLASPVHFRKVKVRGVGTNLEERCYAIWIGQASHLLLNSLDGDGGVITQGSSSRCPLCGALGKYSTSHALVLCTDVTMVQMRTTMLRESDKLLGESPFSMTTRRYGAGGDTAGQQRTVVDGGDDQFQHLREAGDYLLDGDINAMRGVPLKALAVWMLGFGRINNAAIKKGDVYDFLRRLAAQIMVDGGIIVQKYKDLIHDAEGGSAAESQGGSQEEGDA